VSYRVGIDIGGTFTDVVVVDEQGSTKTAKVPSTPWDYAQGIIDGLQAAAVEPEHISSLHHGTTIATNTVVQRTGARTGLITTKGFEGVLEIGRADKEQIFNYWWRPPKPLAHRLHRIGVSERVDFEGAIVEALDEDEVRSAIKLLKAGGIESIAVCCLNSFVNPAHERRIREIVEREWDDVFVCTSFEVMPEIREFERCSTTVVNAYVGPPVERYLKSLERRLQEAGYPGNVLVMNSAGGVMTADSSRQLPAGTALSGPAAGVMAGVGIAGDTGYKNLITLDVGGTSSDVALISNGMPRIAHEWHLGFNIPVRLPAIDLHTVGSGGGSIAWIDGGGSLRVGPRSAGARPGPVCYGLGGTSVTLTDAWLVLGYIDPQFWLSRYGWSLDLQSAQKAIEEQIASPLGLSVERAAHAIHMVTVNNLTQAIHLISVQRGYDPRDFKLVSFGGAAPLLAVESARELGIPQVVVPLAPGVTSALGLLQSNIRLSAMRCVLMREDHADVSTLDSAYAALCDDIATKLHHEKVPPERTWLIRQADVQYYGQSTYLTIDLPEGEIDPDMLRLVFQRFAEEHQREYGYTMPSEVAQAEIANIRVIGEGAIDKAQLRPRDGVMGRRLDGVRTRHVYTAEQGFTPADIFDRWQLAPGSTLSGPAIVAQEDTTTWLPPGSTAHVDAHANLILTV